MLQSLGAAIRLDEKAIAKYLVQMATDIAVVLAGDHNGDHVLLVSNHVPHAMRQHCAAHRLNLAVVKLDNDQSFEWTTNMCTRLYNFFRWPLRCSLLEDAELELSVKLKVILWDVRTRWFSHCNVFDTAPVDMPLILAVSQKDQQLLKGTESKDLALVLHTQLLRPQLVVSMIIAGHARAPTGPYQDDAAT